MKLPVKLSLFIFLILQKLRNNTFWIINENFENFLFNLNTSVKFFILNLVGLTANTTIMYILLCGFGLAFMILETQPRYSYICSWIFVMLAAQGIENIIKWRVRNVKIFSRNNKRT